MAIRGHLTVQVFHLDQALELRLPERMPAHGAPSRLDHRRSQLSPTALGDVALAMGFSGVVNGGAEPSIADQQAVLSKPVDVADGRQQHHCR